MTDLRVNGCASKVAMLPCSKLTSHSRTQTRIGFIAHTARSRALSVVHLERRRILRRGLSPIVDLRRRRCGLVNRTRFLERQRCTAIVMRGTQGKCVKRSENEQRAVFRQSRTAGSDFAEFPQGRARSGVLRSAACPDGQRPARVQPVEVQAAQRYRVVSEFEPGHCIHQC